jgi:hypothetical protein
MRTVLIQRVYTFDPDTQSHVAEAIDVFRRNGFEVFEQAASIECRSLPEEPAADDGNADRRCDALRVVEALRQAGGGLSDAAVCRLTAIHVKTLRLWRQDQGRVDDRTMSRLHELEKRLVGKPVGEVVTVVDAIYAQAGVRRRRPGGRLSIEDRSEALALVRDGNRPREVAKLYGVSEGAVRYHVSKAATSEV